MEEVPTLKVTELEEDDPLVKESEFAADHELKLSPFPEKWEHMDFGGRSYEKLRKAVKNADLFNVSNLLNPPQLLLSLLYPIDPMFEVNLDDSTDDEDDDGSGKKRAQTMKSPKSQKKLVRKSNAAASRRHTRV